MSIDPRTPVLIGAGQYTPDGVPASVAEGEAPAPVDLMARAAERALEDCAIGETARVAEALDAIVAVRTFPDSSSLRKPAEGRASNPPRSVARRIGANPREAIYSNAGGETPQRLVNELCARVAAGELDAALLVGGEAIATSRRAQRLGVPLDWSEEVEGSLEDRGFGTLWLDQSDIVHQLYRPIDIYPLFETAIRAQRGNSVEVHLRSMARLMAPLCERANENPYSFRPRRHSEEELADPSRRNGFLGFPYPRAMNARDGVDMAAAVIVTSAEKARALGVPQDRWVFLHGCAHGRDALYLRDRRDFHSSPGLAVTGRIALGMAGIGVDDIQHIDLYSCFPSALEIACSELNIAEDDSRGLSLTGGLPFFGGPGNNYTTHGIAEAVARCREQPESYAWVSGNGGSVTKHSVGIYSKRAVDGAWRLPDLAAAQEEIDRITGPPTVDAPESGPATIETAMAVYQEGLPTHGYVIAREGREGEGPRFIARVPADGGVEELLRDDVVGLRGRVETLDGKNRLLLQ